MEATGAEAFAGPTLVYMVTQEDAKALPLPDAQKEEFEGKDGQVATAYDLEGFNASRVLLVGLGEKEKMTARTFRVAATTVVKELKARKMTAAGVAVPDVELDDGLSAAGLVAQHAILSDYFYDYGIMDDDRCLHVQVQGCVRFWCHGLGMWSGIACSGDGQSCPSRSSCSQNGL